MGFFDEKDFVSLINRNPSGDDFSKARKVILQEKCFLSFYLGKHLNMVICFFDFFSQRFESVK